MFWSQSICQAGSEVKEMFFRVLASEWNKIRKSSIWIPVLVAPLITIMAGILMTSHGLGHQDGKMSQWQSMYHTIFPIYAILFLPLLAGILASIVCRCEHVSGGWKQLLALPVSRTSVYAAKLLYVLLLLALAQLLVLAGILFIGFVLLHIQDPVPWLVLFKSLAGGWVATIPLAALQLWVSTWWKSFGAQFAVNVIMTIPAIAVVHSSTYGPFYLWVQPMLAMLPSAHGILNVTVETSTTLLITGLVFIIGGWAHFTNRDVHA